MSVTVWFWIAVAALGVGALFSALFHSLKEMVRSQAEVIAQARGPSVYRRVRRILRDVEGHATAVAFPRIVCNMVLAVAVSFWVAGVRGQPRPEPSDALLGVMAASLLAWVFGSIMPHSIAAHAAERTVVAWAWLIGASYACHRPFARLVLFLDEVIRRLAGRVSVSDAEQVEAELLSVVDKAQEKGQFDERERRMIEAVVDFRNTIVKQIMTPRTEIEALELTNNLGEITRFIRRSRHSRIPVYEGDLDHVVGMFYIKDLMRWLAGEGQATGRPFELRAILRPPLFVPQTKTIRELLAELLRQKVHVAMVADEYGGTAGMVTLEDIIEEIFGEIQDEYEQGVEPGLVIEVRPESRTAEMDGRAHIHDANDALRLLGVQLPESEEYDTVGGLVVTYLGRIPAAGERLRLDGVDLTVVAAEPTRVARVRVSVAAGDRSSSLGHPADDASAPTLRDTPQT